MKVADDAMELLVAARTDVAAGITSFEFAAPDGAPLPPFSPGAHIVVSLQSKRLGRARANPYTLTSSPDDRSRYRITVMRQPEGRGGSLCLHDEVRVGDRILVQRPNSYFALDRTARRHLLIAGGIGITPFLSMLQELKAMGASAELHYAFRASASAAFVDELVESFGDVVHLYRGEAGARLPIEGLLAAQPLGTHVYTCGPAALMDEVVRVAGDLGWPPSTVHLERFASPGGGEAFTFETSVGRRSIAVGTTQSMLEAIEAADIDAPSLCRMGACGQCLLDVVDCDGELIHNDHVLSDEERAGKRHILPCVSRFSGRRLVVAL